MEPSKRDCSYEQLRKTWNFSALESISSHTDENDLFKVKTHPLIWLFKMFCWNPKICCVPIGELESFDEFFGIYSIEVSIF